MALVHEFETAGSWLFRWRSYLAIALPANRRLDEDFDGLDDNHNDLAAAEAALRDAAATERQFDRLLLALGSNKMYQAQNPFDFMELISLQGKTNFFERRVGEYQKSGVMTAGQPAQQGFSMEEDF